MFTTDERARAQNCARIVPGFGAGAATGANVIQVHEASVN